MLKWWSHHSKNSIIQIPRILINIEPCKIIVAPACHAIYYSVWRNINDHSCNILIQWFSPGALVSSTNNTDRHDITEILLKVALNTITLTAYTVCLLFVLCHPTVLRPSSTGWVGTVLDREYNKPSSQKSLPPWLHDIYWFTCGTHLHDRII